MFYQIVGYLSGVAILISFVPYARDIFKRTTKPERMSWLLWSILGLISFFSQLAEGASYSLIMTGTQFFGDLLIFILAIKYGVGGLLKRDILGFAGAFFALLFWYISREAVTALFIVIFVDAIGAVLTAIKTYQYPATETVSTWVLTFLAGLLSSIAVAKLDLVLLAVPVYIALVGLAILLAIYFGRKRQGII